VKIKNWLETVVQNHPVLSKAFQDNRAGILFADITERNSPEWASINPDLEIYGASVPKLGILLGILYNDAYASDYRKGVLSVFQDEISKMIKTSDNLESGKLYALTSFQSIKSALVNLGLYQWDESENCGRGGIWCGALTIRKKQKSGLLKILKLPNGTRWIFLFIRALSQVNISR